MTNKEEKARLNGMAFALKIAKEEGIEGLEDACRKRGCYDIPIGIDNKVLKEFSDRVKATTCDTIMTLTLVTLHDEFGFGKARLQRFQDRFDLKTSCLTEDFTTWQEQLDILKEECDIEIAIRENNENVKIGK